jgi:hypothetical protein
MALTAKEEKFCQLIAEYGHKEKVKAYTDAGYSTKMSVKAIGIQADKLFNKPRLSLRIGELTLVVRSVAKEKFSITLRKRLEWLDEIVEAGLEIIDAADGTKKRQHLPAANQAITILNTMLGTDELGGEVKPVKVLIGVKDASRP